MPTKTVVLAHGIFRFDRLAEIFREDLRLDLGPRYFDGIADELRNYGFTVHEPDVNFAGSLASRASEFTCRLDRIFSQGAPEAHVVAHSMGGLDARLAIADDPAIAARVTCLTTIGTPHHGTSVADAAIRDGGRLIIAALLPIIDLQGFEDLTRDRCRAFNERVRDREAANTVRYRAVSAVENLMRTTPLLQAAWLQVNRDEGESDGIVPRSSQAWTRTLVGSDGHTKDVEQLAFPMPADHLNEVGVWDPGELLPPSGFTKEAFERVVRAFYLQLAMSA
jgi:triacylglycerol lipase